MNTFNPKNLLYIENGFKVLKENSQSNVGLELLKTYTEKNFPYKFNINIITARDNSPLFVMSVYPDRSTLDKIIDAVINNEGNKVISKLWSQNKEWTIEIDSRILDETIIDLTDRELSAIYCHEIGHIIYSNSIVNRLSTILQYEIAVTSPSNKLMLRDKFFKKFLSLPILNACRTEKDNSIKNEIKADKFAKKAGYQRELISVMQKFQKCPNYTEDDSSDNGMKKMATFTLNSLEQFRERETRLVECTLERMHANCNSVYVESVLSELLNDYFKDTEGTSMTREKKLNYLYERANKHSNENVITELGRLPELNASTLDYILIKIKDIKTNDDKMMIVSYIHSKLDIIDYYMEVLKRPKKYLFVKCPYTMKELENLKKRLLNLVDMAINAKLQTRHSNVLVSWPEGYEG